MPYKCLFEENGNLIYKKDMSISIFELLDKILKNENSSQMSYFETKHLIEISENPEKITEGIYVNYNSYQYFDPEFLKTQKMLDLMCFEDTAEQFLYLHGRGEI